MGIQDFGTIEADASLKQVIDALADLQDTLNFLINGNLDVKNLRANSVDADRIKAKTITADRMKVTQLSAIAADLGKVVAGILVGAYISTADGTFPRIEFSSSTNLLTAYLDATHYLNIMTNYLGSPGLKYTSGSSIGYIVLGSSFGFYGSGVPVELNSSANVVITAGTNLTAVSVNGTIIDIVSAINSKAPKGLAGTKTYYVSDTASGPATRKLTFTDGVLTSET